MKTFEFRIKDEQIQGKNDKRKFRIFSLTNQTYLNQL